MLLDYMKEQRLISQTNYQRACKNRDSSGSSDIDILYKMKLVKDDKLIECYNSVFPGEPMDCVSDEVNSRAIEEYKLLSPEIKQKVVFTTIEGMNINYAVVDTRFNEQKLNMLYPNNNLKRHTIFKAQYSVLRNNLEGKKEAVSLDDADLLVQMIISDATDYGVADIHFEPIGSLDGEETEYRITFDSGKRLDIWDKVKLDKNSYNAIVLLLVSKAGSHDSTLKTHEGVSAKIDDLLGDGRWTGRIRGGRAEGGACLTLRVQDAKKKRLPLEKLGFSDDNIARLRKIFMIRRGLILITGHTASGKNTTVYSGVGYALEQRLEHMLGFENPIEVRMPYVQKPYDTHQQLLELVDSAKKENPSMVFVNEIPNNDVAKGVRDLVFSNIPVFSTTHINRLWHFPQKLFDFYGLSEYKSILSQTTAIINQKMFMLLCPDCKRQATTFDLYDDIVINLGIDLLDDVIYERNPDGCPQCNKGLKKGGFSPSVEILILDRNITTSLETMESVSRMEDYLYNYMIENKLAMEHDAKDKLLKGNIDLRQIREQEVFEKVV